MVARQKHLGNVQPFERPRSRIVRMFKEPVLEAFFLQRCSLTQNPWNQPDAGLNRDHGCSLTTGKDRVTDGDLFEPSGIKYPLVHPLEPTAQDNHAWSRRPLFHTRLSQGPTTRAHV